jgi:hypothetical protein
MVPILSKQSLPLLTLSKTDLQIYLARSVALGQIALAAISILLSGLLPLTRDNTSVFATPTTFVTTAYHYMSAFQAYTSYASNNQTSYGLGVVGSGALAAMGTWAILFGGGSHISKRTGKDKRTSGFPFGDKEGRTAELKGN